jgi:hypothetical protein
MAAEVDKKAVDFCALKKMGISSCFLVLFFFSFFFLFLFFSFVNLFISPFLIWLLLLKKRLERYTFALVERPEMELLLDNRET